MSITRMILDPDDGTGGNKTESEKDKAAELARKRQQEEVDAAARKDKIKDLEIQLKLEQDLNLLSSARNTEAQLELELLEQKKDQLKRRAELEKQIEDMRQAGFSMSEEEKQAHDALLKQKEDEHGTLLGIQGTLEDVNKDIVKQKALVDKVKKSTNEYLNFWGGIATKIGLGNSGLVKSLMGFSKMSKKIKDNAEEQKKFNEALAETASLALVSIAESVIGSFVMVAMEIDNAQASLAKATGAGGKFNDNLVSLRTSGFETARSAESITASLTAMNKSLIGLNKMSDETINYLGGMSADFQRLGVDSETFTKSLNTMTSTMSVSTTVAADMTKELAMAGTELGISSDIMMKDFVAASSTLAVYGDKSIKVFKGLAAAARTAGVEVSDLISVAGKFNTFASAAETAGKLNAILGSQISATNMLRMSDEERIETLIRSVQAQGVAFKDMDKFTQLAIAQAAGISDMSKANQIFGMSMSEYKKSQKQMKQQKDVQDKFNEAVSATIPLQEKLTEAFKSIASNKDFIDFILLGVELIKFLAESFAKFNRITKGVPVIIFGITMGLMGLAGLLAPMVVGLGGLVSAMGGLSGAFPSLSAAVSKFGVMFSGGMTAAAEGLAILLAAMAAAALIFVIFSGGVHTLSLGMKKLDEANISGITADLGLFIAAMTLGALGQLGAAFAITTFAYAVSGLASEFEKLHKTLPSVAKHMSKFIDDIFGLDQMVNVKVVFTDLVEGLADIDTAIANITGADAIRFHSTLENMALISSGAASFAGGQAAVNMFQPLINLQSPDINNEINLGKLEIVLDNGDTLTGFIQKVAKE